MRRAWYVVAVVVVAYAGLAVTSYIVARTKARDIASLKFVADTAAGLGAI